MDSLEVMFPTSPNSCGYAPSKPVCSSYFVRLLPRKHQAQKLLHPGAESRRSFQLKGAVMDMMWLFALVMGALLLGGIVVYKKSV